MAGAAIGLIGGTSAKFDPPKPAASVLITITMENCQAKRPGTLRNDTSALKMIFSGIAKEELVKRGAVEIDGRKYKFYLPKANAYPIRNDHKSDSSLDNSSTLISVDQGGSGELTKEDGWFANLPIRLGDKMYDVVEIGADGARIVLKPSSSPLRGVIVGRRCPPFSFKTNDGKQITLESLSGKAVILDIWSIT